MKLHRILVLVLLSTLTACGFHLRGDVSLPPEILPLYLDETSASAELRAELRALLQASDIPLAKDKSSAVGTLEHLREAQHKRVVSIDARGRAREYELSYDVYYQLRSEHMDMENVVKLQRELLFDPDNVLGANYEEQNLLRDMRRDAAALIMRQLQAAKPIRPLTP